MLGGFGIHIALRVKHAKKDCPHCHGMGIEYRDYVPEWERGPACCRCVDKEAETAELQEIARELNSRAQERG